MKVLIDGRAVKVLNEVKIILTDQGESEDEQIHIMLNDEGVVIDRFDSSMNNLSSEWSSGHQLQVCQE